MKFLSNIVVLLLGALMCGVGVLFALQNKTPVALDILVHRFEPHSLALWILVSLALGGILGMVTSAFMSMGLRRNLRLKQREEEQLKTELNRSEVEIDRLRCEIAASAAPAAPAQEVKTEEV